VTTYGLPIACPTCAGPVDLLNSHSNGRLSIAVVVCEPCEWEFEVTMRLTPHGRSQAHQNRAAQSKQESKRRAREMVSA